MNSQNNLARWTQPTTDREKRFFSQNSGSISRNALVLWLIQAVWVMFSLNPATRLIESKLAAFPIVQSGSGVIAVVILCFLHYVLHDEVLETISNITDGVKETVNGIMNWLVPIGIIAALVALDIVGVAHNFRDDSFDGKRKENSETAKAELAEALADYRQSLQNIESNRRDDSLSAIAPFAAQLAKANRIKTYDKYDVAAKNGKINGIKSERSLAIAEVQKASSTAVKEAQLTYSSEKQRITGKRDSTDTALTTADDANEAASWGYGWTISIFFLVLFIAIAYKLVLLRVESGIRKNVAFTELDAQGGFFEKLAVATTDILKRQGHRFLVFYHKLGSVGTATLHDFDGKVILKQSSYNTPDSIIVGGSNNDPNDLLGGGGSGGIMPPPMPPAPGQSVGGGLAHKKPWQKPAISAASPAPATITTALRFSSLEPQRQFEMVEALHQHCAHTAKHLLRACREINPLLEKQGKDFFPTEADWTKIVNKCCDYENAATAPVPTADTKIFKHYKYSTQTNHNKKAIIDHFAYVCGPSIERGIIELAFEKVNPSFSYNGDGTVIFQDDFGDKIYKFITTPTPSVQEVDFELSQYDISVQNDSSVQNDNSSVQTQSENGLIYKHGIPYVPYTMKKGDRKGETVELDLPSVKSRARQYFREENATSFKEFYLLFKKFGKQDSELGLPQIGIDRMLQEAGKEGSES